MPLRISQQIRYHIHQQFLVVIRRLILKNYLLKRHQLKNPCQQMIPFFELLQSEQKRPIVQIQILVELLLIQMVMMLVLRRQRKQKPLRLHHRHYRHQLERLRVEQQEQDWLLAALHLRRTLQRKRYTIRWFRYIFRSARR